MDIYYGTAAAARDAAQICLLMGGSSKSPARGYDVRQGYYFRVKNSEGTLYRFFFSGARGSKKQGKR